MFEIYASLSILEIALWISFICIFLFQLFYQLISYRKLLFFKADQQEKSTTPLPPLSVIICAKNEARNLETFLPKILSQDYPDFQVVVVNDCSDDRSEEVLTQVQKQYPNLYFSTIKKDPIYRHGKKLAISLGIKAAKNEHLVFIDADCYPESQLWLRSIAEQFTDETKIVLGVSPYIKGKGLLGQVIGYETLQTAILYISSAMRGKAYMGVGRNMAYTKQLFFDNKGFSGHTHLLSGDDDLFVNKAATPTNVAVTFSPESIVSTLPETHWSLWYKQKLRHMSTGKYYKKGQKLRFSFEAAIGMLFYGLMIALFVISSYPLVIAGVFVFRFLYNSMLRTISAKKMNFANSYFFSSLWLEIIVPINRYALLMMNIIKPQKFTWR